MLVGVFQILVILTLKSTVLRTGKQKSGGSFQKPTALGSKYAANLLFSFFYVENLSQFSCHTNGNNGKLQHASADFSSV